MTAASNSDARKRNAEKASIQAYALARSCKPCRSGHDTACRGVAYDVDEHRTIACPCGCSRTSTADRGFVGERGPEILTIPPSSSPVPIQRVLEPPRCVCGGIPPSHHPACDLTRPTPQGPPAPPWPPPPGRPHG